VSYEDETNAITKNHQKMLNDNRKEIKRQIRLAYRTGGTVPYDLRTLIESGASTQVIRAVYRNNG
jgi:hypothetical protein